MNKRIEAAYEQRPRRWVFELAVAVVVVALLIWSGSAVRKPWKAPGIFPMD